MYQWHVPISTYLAFSPYTCSSKVMCGWLAGCLIGRELRFRFRFAQMRAKQLLRVAEISPRYFYRRLGTQVADWLLVDT